MGLQTVDLTHFSRSQGPRPIFNTLRFSTWFHRVCWPIFMSPFFKGRHTGFTVGLCLSVCHTFSVQRLKTIPSWILQISYATTSPLGLASYCRWLTFGPLFKITRAIDLFSRLGGFHTVSWERINLGFQISWNVIFRGIRLLYRQYVEPTLWFSMIHHWLPSFGIVNNN